MGIYCNEGGRAINGPRCMRCAQSGRACPCLGDGYFDYLKYNGGGHETGWSCGSVRPPSDDEFDKGRNGGVKNSGYGDKAIDSRRLSESELTNLVRRVLIEKEHITEDRVCTDDTDCETGGPRARCLSSGKCGHGEPRDGGSSYSPVDWWEEDEEFGGHVAGGLGCCSRHSGAACIGGFECVDCACQPVVDMIDYDDLEDLEIDMMIPYGPGHPEWRDKRTVNESRILNEDKLPHPNWPAWPPPQIEPYWDGEDWTDCAWENSCHSGDGRRGSDYDLRLEPELDTQALNEDVVKAKRLMGYNPRLTLTEQGIPACMGIIAQGCPGTPEANTTMTTPTTKCATIDNIPVTASDQGRDIMAPMGGVHMTVQTVFPNPNGNGSANVTSAPGPCPRPGGQTSTYRCDGPGCMECLPPNQNHPMCIHTEPTCGGTCGGGTTTSGCLDPSLPNYNPNATLDCSGNPQPPAGYGDTNCCGMLPPPTCNKSCKQLASNFKNKAQGKNCNWLTNRYTAFMNKLSTLTQGTCAYKRVQCKVGIVKALRQQQGC